METKALKKQMGAAIAMVLVAAVALGSATFAWFVNNTKVKAESVSVTAKSANTLLISHGTDNAWGMSAAFKQKTATEFVPVSTVNATDFFKDTAWATETGGDQKGQYNAAKFSAADSSKDYFVDTFQVKSSQDCGLYLDSETKFEVGEGVDANILKSMRLALKVDGKTYFYQIDASNIDGKGNSYNTTLTTISADADGIKKAIASATSDTAAATAGDITGANVDSTSGVIALASGVVAAPSDNTILVAADAAKKLCDLEANEPKTVSVAIWMEGCDYDCNTVMVKSITEKAVSCVLGFCAGANAQA